MMPYLKGPKDSTRKLLGPHFQQNIRVQNLHTIISTTYNELTYKNYIHNSFKNTLEKLNPGTARPRQRKL